MSILSIIFMSNNINIISANNTILVLNEIQNDEELMELWCEGINTGNTQLLSEIYSEVEFEDIEEFFSNKENMILKIGVYNIREIYNYRLIEIDSQEILEKYSACDDVEAYLLYIDCCVYESNEFFMDNHNFYILVTGNDNGRKILQFSVASFSEINNKINELDVDIVNEYFDKRVAYFESKDEFIKITSSDYICNNVNTYAATYTPKSLTSYSFPMSIRVKNTKTSKIENLNFKEYCYVVLATEFGVATDGEERKPHMEALKAFSLCVRNLAWYRCLYPYNATEGYNVTDNTYTQAYNWDINNVNKDYPRHIEAMNAIWDVMMFDGEKCLFHPDYKAGKYNDNKRTDASNFMQNGSNYLANEKSYDYIEILHYYYDDAIGGKISSGPIIICEEHLYGSRYSVSPTRHWKVCNTCGYYKDAAHTWIKFSTFYKCSTCGYTSKVVRG